MITRIEIQSLRQTPMAQGAVRIEPSRLLECAEGLVIPEAVQQRETLIEPLLRFSGLCGYQDMALADSFQALGAREFAQIDLRGLRRGVLMSLSQSKPRHKKQQWQEFEHAQK
ncbi:MAG: hypothetical protein JO323_26550 [Acidobacteriia bacterium]|nr:hypothetical protein [Terriglobia bacterium]